MKIDKTITKKDLLQPGDPRFKRAYGYDPIEMKEKRKRKKKEIEEKKKEKLEEKYWRMKKKGLIKPWEEKDLRRIVLEERGI